MTAFAASRPDIVPLSRAALQAMVSAYLGRYRGATRSHTESDLRIFLTWCTGQEVDPLAARRPDIERYVRWLQDARCYQPSTVSRRLSVVIGFYRVCVIGFYRVCVIDQVLPYSPAFLAAFLRCAEIG